MSPPSETEKAMQGSVESVATRAQLASNLLNQLELQELREEQSGQNGFGLNWNEETINLSLFEELEEIEYTPPTSPTRQQAQALENSIVINKMAPSTPRLALNPASVDMDTIALATEFQAILESLQKEDANAMTDNQIIHIAGIPITLTENTEQEALIPVKVDWDLSLVMDQNLRTQNNISGFDEDDLMVMQIDQMEQEQERNYSPTSSSGHFFDESDLRAVSEYGSNPGSPSSSVASCTPMATTGVTVVSVVDQHSEAAEKILDALMLGDVITAESYLPAMNSAHGEESMDLSENDDSEEMGPDATDETILSERVAKSERRGRKPGPSGKLPKKDKALRKKEQNKSAAVRYRQKKKVEFASIQETEKELQDKRDDFQKQKESLGREILMVKQLLRDIIKAKQNQK